MRQLSLTLLIVASTAQSAAPKEVVIGAAEALLRYEAPSLAKYNSDFCVTIGGREISQEFRARILDTGLQIPSCGKEITVRFSIGDPVLKADGNYNVSYGYFRNCTNCALQGRSMSAVMSQSATGWLVLHVRPGGSF